MSRLSSSFLGAGAALLVVVLVLHPPVPPENAAFMELIGEKGAMWKVIHWIAALSLVSLFLGAVLALTMQPKPMAAAAYAMILVAGLFTAFTAILEATVMSDLATAGDLATFNIWNGFVEGTAFGFLFYGLGVAGLAAHQLRSAAVSMPRWLAWIGIPFGLLSSVSWGLLQIAGMPVGPVWLISSALSSIWLAFFSFRDLPSVTSAAQAVGTDA